MTSRKQRDPVLLEIAVQDVAGAIAAVRSGADRLELCVALASTGGLTPSIGLVKAVCAAVALEAAHEPVGVCVLVRPSEGGFVYDEAAVAVMEADLEALAGIPGVEAVVLGALTRAGRVDLDVMRRMMAAAGRLPVVFHRAIDVASSPEELLDAVISLGCVRVLSSGGAPVSGDGLHVLRRMVEVAAGRIQIMAGGGLTLEAIPELVAAGVDSIHLSAKAFRQGDPAGPGGGHTEVMFTDGDVVALARDALRLSGRMSP
ncbi:copper homeostasis protein CutC [Galactobacter caseinivorans]|uniref:PF03932 family protein CutC n=1 Tax=Galactobacter caseinivorans TaxID=2676123 RepID=A0A496PFE8_9MICC|nr:copper homeostasis protein CutC [Galactobacter caseinivorans]RKW69421.1 copper homeostasis protein CutC [Galactobacter caseinivorans]